jgi:uncharacterized protein YfdQ (DUF2303 family)
MTEEPVNNVRAIIDIARDNVKPELVHTNDGLAVLYTPKYGFHTINRETGLLKPLRKRGRFIVFDPASFNQFLKDNADAGDIAVYFDRNVKSPAVVAVLNAHGKNGAGWGDLRCEIEFRRTPQWERWAAADGKMMPQVAFAEFIEDNIADIASPAGSTMLEVATQLDAKRTLQFRSGVRLQDGRIQFQHLEDLEAKVGAGEIAVPEMFSLGIAPIFGMPSYQVPVRFRYRIEGGKLTMGFRLQRTEDMMRQIIEDVIAKIERGANVSVMEGREPQQPPAR